MNFILLKPLDIVVIGAGNLATHLAPALQEAGHRILQVFSRTEESASALASRLSCGWTTEVEQITPRAEVYIFSVRDAVLEELARRVYDHLKSLSGQGTTSSPADGDVPAANSTSSPANSDIPAPATPATGADALFVHTAGSMSMEVLPSPRRGVLYPMQTFSRSRAVRFREIPVFVESPTDESLLLALASQLSARACALDGERRRLLHLAAVFACNFVNHMYDLADGILTGAGLPFDVMLPLIDETARKVHQLRPRQAQTGPAVRYDRNVMERQIELLPDGQDRLIYELLSKSIHDRLQLDKD